MLPENEIKAQISIAYIHAVASTIGCTIKTTNTDYDSVDIGLCYGAKVCDDSIYESTELNIQLKCTSTIEISKSETTFSYPLPIKNYNDLRKRCATPRILVVLCLPNHASEWLKHSCDELTIRRCAYWVNLSKLPDTAVTSKKTISIPTENIFSPNGLKLLLEKISKDIEL